MSRVHKKRVALIGTVVSLLFAVCLMAQVGGTKDAVSEEAALQTLALASLWKMESGRIAAARASSKAVRDFAAQMINRYRSMAEEIASLAGKKGISLSGRLNQTQENTLAYMAAQRGAEIDREYVSMTVDDLAAEIKMSRSAVTTAKDPAIRTFLAAAAQKLEEDRRRADTILDALPQPILK